MTVGETIADARGAAGLSVNEVSERTRIRETVIRSIERDDFDALGGDLYVRGYLRAIAGVVGVDPQPLIREFDAARGPGLAGWPTIGSSSQAAAGEPEAAAGTEDVATETRILLRLRAAEPVVDVQGPHDVADRPQGVPETRRIGAAGDEARHRAAARDQVAVADVLLDPRAERHDVHAAIVAAVIIAP